MQLDQFTHQSQPDPSAFVGPATRAWNPVKAIKQVRNFLRWNSDAGVANPEFCSTAHLRQSYLNLSLECELKRVRNQIQNDLLPHVAIHVGDFLGRLALNHEPQAG